MSLELKPPPSAGRHAVIDVGTNSVKLLVATIVGRHITPVHETSVQTRLGKGFYQHHLLQAIAIRQTAEAVQRFAGQARDAGANTIRVLATNAAREARNSDALVRAVREASSLDLEIIPGELEADLVYQGVLSGCSNTNAGMMLIDVGGGSTEIIIGTGPHPKFSGSYPLGTVRLLESCPHGDPPSGDEREEVVARLRQQLETEIAPTMKGVMETFCLTSLQLIGTGGTSTLLARMVNSLEGYDRARIEATVLSIDDVTKWFDRLWSLPMAQRGRIVGLPPEKADVILAGVAIYQEIMKFWRLPSLGISMRGLRFGALLQGQVGQH